MTDAMTCFARAVHCLEDHADRIDVAGPVGEADLALASTLLGLEFPLSYRAYLQTFGAGAFGTVEIYGIIAGRLPGRAAPSVVWRTLDERARCGMPHRLIPILDSGYGPLICLETTQVTADGECAVVEWSPSIGQAPTERIADSFGAFFLQEIEAAFAM